MEWNDFSHIHLEASVSPQIYERGMDYLHQGHLLKACKIDNILAGVLAGTGGNYKVRLWVTQSGLQGECDCPYHGFCKHMVALAAAWMEEKGRFVDLQSNLAMIQANPSLQTDILLALIHKDPLNLLELFPEQNIKADFINARGVLNLIRNAFSAPHLTPTDAEALWEKVKHIHELIAAKFQAGDPEAPGLLIELISSLEKTVAGCHQQFLNRFFLDFLKSLLPANHENRNMIGPLGQQIFEIYFNPDLWELAVEIKPMLLSLCETDTVFLLQQVEERFESASSLLTLIALYALLADIASPNLQFQELLSKVTAKLCSTSEGCLWLVDRLLEDDPDQAFQTAKMGLKRFPLEKAGFRERLIGIHQKRAELKQAAALSFIQFQEGPNFEEYLRLKKILSQHPANWEQYLGKIKRLLAQQGLEVLSLRILIAEKDYQGIAQNWERMTADDTLLMAAASLFAVRVEADFTPLYPALIKILLERRTASEWKAASQLLITFKRYCNYDVAKKNEWLLLGNELRQMYQDDGGFMKKFGGILADRG
jgi:Uncharacterized conserved protein